MIKLKLFEARRRKNYSQEYIAKGLGMNTSSYCRRENGQVKISMFEWQKISELLNVPLNSIYENDEVCSSLINSEADESWKCKVSKYLFRYINS